MFEHLLLYSKAVTSLTQGILHGGAGNSILVLWDSLNLFADWHASRM